MLQRLSIDERVSLKQKINFNFRDSIAVALCITECDLENVLGNNTGVALRVQCKHTYAFF